MSPQRGAQGRFTATDLLRRLLAGPLERPVWARLSGAVRSRGLTRQPQARAAVRSRALPRRCCHAKAIVNALHATDCGGTRVETNRQLLLVQGGQDRIAPPAHAHRLMRHCRSPELWLRPHDGHISILNACPLAMD